MIGLSIANDYQIMTDDFDRWLRAVFARAQEESLTGASAPLKTTMTTTTAYSLLTVPLHDGIVPERSEVFVSTDRGEWRIADPSSWCQDALTRVSNLVSWNPRLGSDPGDLIFRPRSRRGRADLHRDPRGDDLQLVDLCPELAIAWRDEIARVADEEAASDANWRATSAERARRNDDLQRRLGDAGHADSVLSRRFRD